MCAVFVILFSPSSLVLLGDILGWDFLARSASTEIAAQHTLPHQFQFRANAFFLIFFLIFFLCKKTGDIVVKLSRFFFFFFSLP